MHHTHVLPHAPVEFNDMDSAEGFSEDGSHRPSNIAFHSMFHHDRRRRYAVALRVTAKLKESNLIDQRGRAALKELISNLEGETKIIKSSIRSLAKTKV